MSVPHDKPAFARISFHLQNAPAVTLLRSCVLFNIGPDCRENIKSTKDGDHPTTLANSLPTFNDIPFRMISYFAAWVQMPMSSILLQYVPSAGVCGCHPVSRSGLFADADWAIYVLCALYCSRRRVHCTVETTMVVPWWCRYSTSTTPCYVAVRGFPSAGFPDPLAPPIVLSRLDVTSERASIPLFLMHHALCFTAGRSVLSTAACFSRRLAGCCLILDACWVLKSCGREPVQPDRWYFEQKRDAFVGDSPPVAVSVIRVNTALRKLKHLNAKKRAYKHTRQRCCCRCQAQQATPTQINQVII